VTAGTFLFLSPGIIILYCSIPSNLYGGCSELFRSVRKSLGVFATLHGVPAAMKLFGVSAFVARYWKQKIADPDFHSKPYGGFQYRYALSLL